MKVAEDDAAGLVTCLVFDQFGDGVADSAQADVAEGVAASKTLNLDFYHEAATFFQ